jgi:hypothetical protein
MNSAADRRTGGDDHARLPYVVDMDWDAFLSARGTALANGMRRLAQETNSDGDTVAAFGNFAPTDPEPDPVATPTA